MSSLSRYNRGRNLEVENFLKNRKSFKKSRLKKVIKKQKKTEKNRKKTNNDAEIEIGKLTIILKTNRIERE